MKQRKVNFCETECGSIFEIIKEHTQDKPIQGKKIAREIGITDVRVRTYVNHLRTNGNQIERRICSNSKGYYLALSENEIQHTVNQLRSRAMKMLSAMKGVSTSFNPQNEKLFAEL